MRDTSALLSHAASGDAASLDELFARHAGRLLACLRVMVEPSLARVTPPEDLLQETLLEASRKIGGFENRGPSSFYRWLVAIARFKVAEADRARRAGKRAAVGSLHDDPLAAGPSPSRYLEQGERALAIRGALEQIPPDQAEAIRLRYLEGLSGEETAERMGRTSGAIKSLVSRALEALAGRLPSPG